MTIIKWKTLPVVDEDDAAEATRLSSIRFVKLRSPSPLLAARMLSWEYIKIEGVD